MVIIISILKMIKMRLRDVEKLARGHSAIRYWTRIQLGAGLQSHILSFYPKLCLISFYAWPVTPQLSFFFFTPQLSKLSSAITSSKLGFNFLAFKTPPLCALIISITE